MGHVFVTTCFELSIKLAISCRQKHIRHLNKELEDERISFFVTFGRINPKAIEANGIRNKCDDVFHRFLLSFDKDVLTDTGSFVRRLLQHNFHLRILLECIALLYASDR